MPDGSLPIRHDAGSNSTERLNSAIDRMLNGGPPPILNDPELQDLLQLAALLHNELPDDLPDPAFRLNLKQQLTTTYPIPVAVHRQRVAAPVRFPWVAAVSAIAAVMLAAISIGSLAIWLDNDSDDSPGFREVAVFSADQLTATTIGISTTTAEANLGNPTATIAATAPNDRSRMTTIPPAGDEPETAVATSGTEPTTIATATIPVASTRSTDPTATSDPTTGPSLAAVPPVDAEHVEQGPRPAADGSSGTPAADVTYVLETSLPDLGDDAHVYRLAPPEIDPEVFVERVANELGMVGDIVVDAPMGRTVYHLFDDDRGSFHWTPETGAFTISMTSTTTGASMPFDQVVVAATDWLTEIGYPVDQLATDVRAEPMGNAAWRLDARYDSMPEIGLGHPLGVTVYINADGTISEVSGYWLEVKEVDSAHLHSADAIWQAVSSGNGYWTGGGIVEGGGEFRVDAMQITYLLTRDPSGDLVLQPVVETSGEFTTADGLSSARVSCYVQAARTTDESAP